MKIALLAPLVVSTLMMGSAAKGQEMNIPKQTFQSYIGLCEELGQEIEIVVKRPHYNIPMDEKLQDYIWQLSQQHDIPFELILGLIKTESNFNPKVTSYNGSSVGLFQLNHNTYPWLAKELNIKNVNPRNPFHSARMGVYYLSMLRDNWIDKGYSKDKALHLAVMSFNKGEAGTKQHLRQYGSRSKYTTKVYDNKNKIMKGE